VIGQSDHTAPGGSGASLLAERAAPVLTAGWFRAALACVPDDAPVLVQLDGVDVQAAVSLDRPWEIDGRALRLLLERKSLQVADLVLDEDARDVRRGGVRVRLSPTEYRLLHLLMSNTGRVLSHQEIIERLWGFPYDINLVQSYVSTLRRKLGRPWLIHTRHCIGYILQEQPV
jgi:Transcriptional regulatory protein, C terminal